MNCKWNVLGSASIIFFLISVSYDSWHTGMVQSLRRVISSTVSWFLEILKDLSGTLIDKPMNPTLISPSSCVKIPQLGTLLCCPQSPEGWVPVHSGLFLLSKASWNYSNHPLWSLSSCWPYLPDAQWFLFPSSVYQLASPVESHVSLEHYRAPFPTWNLLNFFQRLPLCLLANHTLVRETPSACKTQLSLH